MHYHAYAFSWNNEKTIITKDPIAVIGQRQKLSVCDIERIQVHYGCKETVSVHCVSGHHSIAHHTVKLYRSSLSLWSVHYDTVGL